MQWRERRALVVGVAAAFTSVACGLTTDSEDEGQPPETPTAARPEAQPPAPAGAPPTQPEPEPEPPALPEPSPGSEETSDAEYDGASICQVKSPFEEMPPGCPQNRPSAGSECPQGSEGARCPGGMEKVGTHYRQTVMYCENQIWIERSQPCSNECTAPGPNAVELPDDCDARPIVACDGQPLASLVAATVNQCEAEIFNNIIQVQVIDGCARVVSSSNGVGKCVTDALASKRWECDDGLVCATAGSPLL